MVSRDITDQIALEHALRRAKEQAERASNAKSEFLSRVSHELRTPLNAMLGFTQLLELEELEDPSTEYVEQISKAGDHLLALINEVLDIARIESDNVLFQIEPIPAIDAVQEVIDLTAPLAARAGVSLHGPDDGGDVLARGRPPAPAAGAAEPRLERHQVQPRGRPGGAHRRASTTAGCPHRARHRARARATSRSSGSSSRSTGSASSTPASRAPASASRSAGASPRAWAAR